MFKKPIASLLSVFALTVASQSALAVVSAEQVARLGQDLTPMGAEKAGNADGTIPEWTGGGIAEIPAG